MKLSSREVKMIKDIPKKRRDRKRSAWSGLIAALALLIAVFVFDYRVNTLGMFLGMMVGLFVGRLANEYFLAKPEDRLIDLLLRYVNEDSEVVTQLSGDSK